MISVLNNNGGNYQLYIFNIISLYVVWLINASLYDNGINHRPKFYLKSSPMKSANNGQSRTQTRGLENKTDQQGSQSGEKNLDQ